MARRMKKAFGVGMVIPFPAGRGSGGGGESQGPAQWRAGKRGRLTSELVGGRPARLPAQTSGPVGGWWLLR